MTTAAPLTYQVLPLLSLTVLTAGIASFQNVNCNGGNDGQATGGAFGGTGPYTYFWTPSGSTDATITDLTAGEYILLVSIPTVHRCRYGYYQRAGKSFGGQLYC